MIITTANPGMLPRMLNTTSTETLMLEERLRQEMARTSEAEHVPEEGEVAEDDAVVDDPPVISCEMRAMVRLWAKAQFLEKMMYGEEEETGIPPLSIEI